MCFKAPYYSYRLRNLDLKINFLTLSYQWPFEPVALVSMFLKGWAITKKDDHGGDMTRQKVRKKYRNTENIQENDQEYDNDIKHRLSRMLPFKG